jgi:hypothetical protein
MRNSVHNQSITTSQVKYEALENIKRKLSDSRAKQRILRLNTKGMSHKREIKTFAMKNFAG